MQYIGLACIYVTYTTNLAVVIISPLAFIFEKTIHLRVVTHSTLVHSVKATLSILPPAKLIPITVQKSCVVVVAAMFAKRTMGYLPK